MGMPPKLPPPAASFLEWKAKQKQYEASLNVGVDAAKFNINRQLVKCEGCGATTCRTHCEYCGRLSGLPY